MAIFGGPGALRTLSLSALFCASLADAPVDAATGDEEPEMAQAADEPIAAAEVGRVYLATPVGRVSFGPETVEAGHRMDATRSLVAGSASAVSLSSVQRLGGRSGARSASSPIRTGNLVVTSSFGAVRPTAEGGMRVHAGVDLAAPTGSPVAAAYDGRVLSATWAGSYGLLVVLDHGDGLQTRYAHLSRLMVASGQQVRQGDLIGLVGSTGRSTGPHLHYELRRNGVAVNPLPH